MVTFGKASTRIAGATMALLAGMQIALASPLVYNFDSFSDFTSVTTQIAGLTFGQATVLKAGFSLNEIAVPPRSGDNVVFDDGGAMTIDFATPVSSAGGYVTYLSPLTLRAYDSGNNLLGTINGSFAINLADGSGDPGSSPNEFLSFSDAAGRIARVVIEGNPGGSSFALDDLTVDAVTSIPEPTTLALLLGVLAAGCLRGGWLRRFS
jgi:hypothetical protein